MRELSRASRQGSPVAVTMADIDHFKAINDTYGHLAGDTVLREAAKRMNDLTRPYDGVGRYGGEEFMIVLAGCKFAGAATASERLRDAIAREPIKIEGGAVSITCSLGGASTDLIRDPDAKCLIRAADRALYRTKRMGRNRVELAATADLMEE